MRKFMCALLLFGCSVENQCVMDSECPADQECTPSGACVARGTDAGRIDSDAGSIPIADGGIDAGVDSGVQAVLPESCTRSDSVGLGADEDADGMIDEGCTWHFGIPHPVVRVHVRDGEHYFPRLSADSRRVYFGAQDDDGRFVPHFAERTGVGAQFSRPRAVPGPWGPGHAYSVTMRADQREAFVQMPNEGPQYIFRATRASIDQPFGELERVEVSVVGDGMSRHPFVTPDGLELFFNVYDEESGGRVYVARRPHLASDFGAAELLELPGSTADVSEEAPFLVGRDFFFTRYDGDQYRSFRATRSADGETYTDVVELTAIGLGLATTYDPATRELWFSAQPGTDFAPTSWSMWRVEVCRDGPCPDRSIACGAPGARSPDGLHCYDRRATPLDWESAEADCATRGGHLASVHSEAERALIWDAFGSSPRFLFLGGTDEVSEGTYTWSSGEPWLAAPFGVFQPTGAPQPDDTSGGENCVDMDHTIIRAVGSSDTGFLNDASCDANLEYVCENELWPVW